MKTKYWLIIAAVIGVIAGVYFFFNSAEDEPADDLEPGIPTDEEIGNNPIVLNPDQAVPELSIPQFLIDPVKIDNDTEQNLNLGLT